MNLPYTPRYSVCTPGEPPVEVQSMNDRATALALAESMPGTVVYDWSTGDQISEWDGHPDVVLSDDEVRKLIAQDYSGGKWAHR